MPTVDLHVHVAAKDVPGCKVSPATMALPAFTYMVAANGISPVDLVRDFDATICDHILNVVRTSRTVDKCVLLALDALYRDGIPDMDASHVVVSNEYVRELVRANRDQTLFGASLNPNIGHDRGRDRVMELVDGDPPAALFKLLPNVQLVQPELPDHDWFYELLAENEVPLLCHSGPEYAIPVPRPKRRNQRLGDPRTLQRALDIGVKVIVAHAGTRFFPWDDVDYLDELAELMAEADRNGAWQLYADISALCVDTRWDILDEVVAAIPGHRMVLGSDYPVPVSDSPKRVWMSDEDLEDLEAANDTKNAIDKNVRLLRLWKFDAGAGRRAWDLLSPKATV